MELGILFAVTADERFAFLAVTCRPNEHQSTVYNGHKRVHALKFQSVTIPNGLIANLYGPVGKKGIHLCTGLFPQNFHLISFLNPT